MRKFALFFRGRTALFFINDDACAGWIFQRLVCRAWIKLKAEQPHWVTPLATTTPRLEEEYRYDQFWQENAKGITTNNYDGGKGLELIPFEKVEVFSMCLLISRTTIPGP